MHAGIFNRGSRSCNRYLVVPCRRFLLKHRSRWRSGQTYVDCHDGGATIGVDRFQLGLDHGDGEEEVLLAGEALQPLAHSEGRGSSVGAAIRRLGLMRRPNHVH